MLLELGQSHNLLERSHTDASQAVGNDERSRPSHWLPPHVRHWKEYIAVTRSVARTLHRLRCDDRRLWLCFLLSHAKRAERRLVPERSRERGPILAHGKRSRRRRQDLVLAATTPRSAAGHQDVVRLRVWCTRHYAESCPNSTFSQGTCLFAIC